MYIYTIYIYIPYIYIYIERERERDTYFVYVSANTYPRAAEGGQSSLSGPDEGQSSPGRRPGYFARDDLLGAFKGSHDFDAHVRMLNTAAKPTSSCVDRLTLLSNER